MKEYIDSKIKEFIINDNKIGAIKFLRETDSTITLGEALKYVNHISNISDIEDNEIDIEDNEIDVKKIINDAIEKHNINISNNDKNIEDLVRYVLTIGYNRGYKDGNNLPIG